MLLRRASYLNPSEDLLLQAFRRCLSSDDGEPEGTRELGVPPSGRHHTLAFDETDEIPLTQEESPAIDSVPQNVAAAVTVADGPSKPRGPSVAPKSKRKNTDSPALKRGSVIAGYEIAGVLGVGGMGQVYRANQLSMSREVAFKVLSPKLAGNEDFRTRFVREARNAGRLQHPHLISVHDVGEKDGMLFFSMELVEGVSVRKMIKGKGRLSEMKALSICRQTLDALSYAHSQGIVHRDIKPDNIMVAEDGMVKVADLGLSRLNEPEAMEESGLTRSGTVMGTPFYMAPEQGRDARCSDPRVDIYAVGASLYHMVIGDVPFRGTNAMDVLLKAATQDVEFPANKPLSSAIKTLILSLMAKKPEDRPEDAGTAILTIDSTGILTGTTPVSEPLVAHTQQRKANWLFRTALSVGITLILLMSALLAVNYANRESGYANAHEAASLAVRNERYDRALEHLDEFNRDYPGGDERIEASRIAITTQWNEYTKTKLEMKFAAVEDHLAANDLVSARKELSSFRSDRSFLSPWTIERLAVYDDRISAQVGAKGGSVAVPFDVQTWLAAAIVNPAPSTPFGKGPMTISKGNFNLAGHDKIPTGFRLRFEANIPEQSERGHMELIINGRGPMLIAVVNQQTTRLIVNDERLKPRGGRGLSREDRNRLLGMAQNAEPIPHQGTARFDIVWTEGGISLEMDGRPPVSIEAQHEFLRISGRWTLKPAGTLNIYQN